MSKARDGVEDLKTIDANLAAKAPIASPSFTGNGVLTGANSADLLIKAPTDNATLTLQAGSTDSGAESSFVKFVQNTNSKWQLGMNTDNSFRLYSYNASAEVFKVDPTGIVTKPLQPSFRVGDSTQSTAGQIMTHNTIFHNVGNHYATATGKFTAPVAGVYFVGAQLISGFSSTSAEQNIKILKNGAFLCDARAAGYTSSSLHAKSIILLAANDYIQIEMESGKSYADASHNQFMGYLIG